MVDQAGGGGENMRGGAIILLELDHRGFGKILFEAQDIGDFRAAPRIDRLVIVADAADVLAALREQAQPEILRAVGVLIFVDQDIFEPLLVALQDFAVGLQEVEDMQQQVAEVAGVERDQAGLIGRVKFLAAAIGVAFILVGIEIGGVETAILPLVDQAGKHPRRPAFLVDFCGLDQLLEQAQLVIGVENGEIALQADQFGVLAQHFRADAVEGAEPRHPLEALADDRGDPFLHLAGGLVGEGHGENFAGPGLAREDDMGESASEGSGLAGAGTGEDQHRAVGGQHGLALRRIEAAHIGRVALLRYIDSIGHR